MQLTTFTVTRRLLTPALALGLTFAVGCGDSADRTDATDNDATNTANAGDTSALDGLFLDTAPEGAKSITELKASAKEGDEVVVHVIVGGGLNPIVEGRASAMIVDSSLANACVGEDDHCKTPWDYCCTPQEDITANLATLQVVDSDGRVVAADLSEKIKPLSTLTVRGIVGPRPDDQVLTINATGIHVESAVQ